MERTFYNHPIGQVGRDIRAKIIEELKNSNHPTAQKIITIVAKRRILDRETYAIWYNGDSI